MFNKPRPMTIEEIDDLVDRFAFTSKAIYDAGANGVQLHAAHGYLLSQYLSPNVNLRTDKYGGSLENRMRIVLEIVAAIRERVPDKAFMISIKVTSFLSNNSQPSLTHSSKQTDQQRRFQ